MYNFALCAVTVDSWFHRLFHYIAAIIQPALSCIQINLGKHLYSSSQVLFANGDGCIRNVDYFGLTAMVNGIRY